MNSLDLDHEQRNQKLDRLVQRLLTTALVALATSLVILAAHLA